MKSREKPNGRAKLSTSQRDFLNACFEVNQNPTMEERMYIAQRSSVPEEKVRNWFQNRRAKEKDNADAPPCLNFSSVDVAEAAFKIYPSSNDLYTRR